MSCWRCGQPTEEGQVECPKCANVTVTYSDGGTYKFIDWDKVHSFEDAKKIFACMRLRVNLGSPDADALREFLED